MFAKDISLLTSECVSTTQIVELLERMFTFESNKWKKEIKRREKETRKYHVTIKIGNLSLSEILTKKQKLVVKEVKIGAWDRDDNDGADITLMLNLE